MKKIVIGTIAAIATTSAFAAPTLYGKINKELRYVSQEDEVSTRVNSGVTDVDGSESRFGIKGSQSADGMNVDYKLEVGVNSSKDASTTNSSSTGLRIRQANVKVNTSYGSWTLGRATHADRVELDKLDAFSGTSAASVSSNGDLVDFSKVGSKARSRNNMIGYTSPTMMGLTVSVEADKDDNTSLVRTDAVSNWYAATATYARDIAGMNFRIHATKAMEDSSQAASDTANSFTNLGLTLGNKVWGFGVRLGMQNDGKAVTATGKDQETDHMLVSAHYMMGMHKLALTYKTSKEDYSAEKQEYSQISAGMICKVSKHVSSRLIVQKSTFSQEATAIAGSLKEIGATSVITGITVKF